MFCWDLPINTEGIVENADATIGFWVIKVITLVLEDGGLGEDGEAVGKALRNEELTMIVLGQLYRYMLAIRWRTLADIYSYIKYSTLYAAYQFALGIRWTLEVQATHYAIAAHRLIVLAEVNTVSQDWGYLFFKLSLAEALEEVATSITEEAWLYNEYAFNICFNYIHWFIPSLTLLQIQRNLQHS